MVISVAHSIIIHSILAALMYSSINYNVKLVYFTFKCKKGHSVHIDRLCWRTHVSNYFWSTVTHGRSSLLPRVFLSFSQLLDTCANYTWIDDGEVEPGMESCPSVALLAMVWYEYCQAPTHALWCTMQGNKCDTWWYSYQIIARMATDGCDSVPYRLSLSFTYQCIICASV